MRPKRVAIYEKFKREFKQVGDALKCIDPKAPDAMNQIRDWYYSKYEELRRHLEMARVQRTARTGVMTCDG